MRRHPLLLFFSLTFVFTWVFMSTGLLLHGWLEPVFGELGPGNPVYHLGVYSPAFAAFVVIWVTRGTRGACAYLRRLLHWGVGIQWYLVVLVGLPAMYFLVSLLSHWVLVTPLAWSFSPWYVAIPHALSMMILNPGAVEEIGWRGFALPLLQQRYNALLASLVLGFIWALWHVPAFFIGVDVYARNDIVLAIGLFFVLVTAMSVIFTFIYNGTKGSTPLAMLAHWMANDPLKLRPDPKDEVIFAMVIVAVAIGLTLVGGYRRLGRSKETDPLPNLNQRCARPENRKGI